MMDEEEDLHVCLVCNRTISGLSNYVYHKKKGCRKIPKVETDLQHSYFPSNDATTYFPNQSFAVHQNAYLGVSGDDQQQTYPGMTSQQPSSSVTNPALMTYSDLPGPRTVNTYFQKLSEGLQNLSHKTISTSRDQTFPLYPVSISVDKTTVNDNLSKYSNGQTNLAKVEDMDIFVANGNSSMYSTDDASLANVEDIGIFGVNGNSSMYSTGDTNSAKVEDISTFTNQEDHGLLTATVNKINQNVPDFRHVQKKADTNSIDVPGANLDTTHTLNVSDIQNSTRNSTFIGKEGTFKTEKCMTSKVDDNIQSIEVVKKTDTPKVENKNLNYSSDEEDIEDDISVNNQSEDSEICGGVHRGDIDGTWRPSKETQKYCKHRSSIKKKRSLAQAPSNKNGNGSNKASSRSKNISLKKSVTILTDIAAMKQNGKSLNSQNAKELAASPNSYNCHFCNKNFTNRFQYSNHCGSKLHKVLGKKKPDCINTQVIGVSTLDRIVDDRENNYTDESDVETTHVDSEEVEDGKQNDSNFVKGDTNTFNVAVIQTDVHNEISSQMNICTVCDITFNNRYLIAKHLLTQLHRNRAVANPELHVKLVQQFNKYIVRLSPYQCALCRFYFNSNSEFEKHIKSDKHRSQCEDLVGEMQCSLCCFKTKYHSEILLHLDSLEHVTNVGNGKLMCILKECNVNGDCKFCGLIVHSPASLKHHIKIKHADGKYVRGIKKRKSEGNQSECKECNKKFANKNALGLHIQKKHSRENPYTCEICNVGFAGKSALKAHLKSSKHVKRSVDAEIVSTEMNVEEMETMLVKNLATKSKKDKIAAENDLINTAVKTHKNLKQKKTEKYFETVNDDAKEATADSSKNEQDKMIADNITNANDSLDKDDAEDYFENTKKTTTKSSQKAPYTRKKNKYGDESPWKNSVNKSIKCKHCPIIVASYDDLRPHYLKAHSKRIRICELCDQVLLSETALKLHVLSSDHQNNIKKSVNGVDTKNKYFECHICKKKFTDENYCKFHTAYQHYHLITEDAILQDNGGKDVTREKYHKFLIELEDKIIGDQVKCPECGVSIKKSGVLIHLRTHTGDSPFKCKVCPSSFVSNYTLRRHLLRHFGCEDKTCSLCNKQFHKTETYERHMLIHDAKNSNVEKIFKCDQCEQSFFFAYQLQNHVLRHRERTFACPYPGCIWKFCFKFELNCHIKTHMNIKPFLCDLCGYAGSTKHMLARHRRTHTGERKYHCEYCTYKAGNITHLHRHMRIHIGSKPFKCPYCNYVCNTHENMSKHIQNTRKHEGLKVYPCKFCDYGTNVSTEFRKHLLENHKSDLELGPGEKLPTLSIFTGLYRKELDIQKPVEGMKIIQLKERRSKRRTFQDDVNVDENFKMEESPNPTSEKKRKKTNRNKRNYCENNIRLDKGSSNAIKDEPWKDDDQSVINNTIGRKYVEVPICSEFQGTSEQVVNICEPIQLIHTMPSIGYMISQSDMCLSSALLVKPPRDDAYKHFPTLCVGEPYPVKLTASTSIGTHYGGNSYDTFNGLDRCLNTSSQHVGLPQTFYKVDNEDILQYHDYCTRFGVSHCSENGEDANSNLIIDMK